MTREIPLTQGFVATIDAVDWPLVQGCSWSVAVRRERNSVRYYAQGFIEGNVVLMHRILTGAEPRVPVDHRDGDGLNNRRSNLRIATTAQNGANSIDRERCSGYRGVYPNRKRWMARVGGRHIGTFDTPLEAALERDRAALDAYGEFAVLNFPATEDQAA